METKWKQFLKNNYSEDYTRKNGRTNWKNRSSYWNRTTNNVIVNNDNETDLEYKSKDFAAHIFRNGEE